MAKPPEEIQDRFRIVCEVDEKTMGTVVKVLTRMGLQGIGYELVTDVKAWGRNGARIAHTTSAQDAIIAFTQEHPTFQTDEVIDHFKTLGRTPASCYSALKTMTDKGLLAKPRPGNYQRIDGLLAPPETSSPAPAETPAPDKKQRGTTPRYETSNKNVILAFIKNRKTFTVKEVQELLEQNGRTAQSASPVLSGLMNKDKMIEMIEPGKYRKTKGATNG